MPPSINSESEQASVTSSLPPTMDPLVGKPVAYRPAIVVGLATTLVNGTKYEVLQINNT